MEQLRREIKNKELNGLYLFCGEEKYLINTWEKSFIKACIPIEFAQMNTTVLEGGAATPEKIAEAAETLPFMSDKKLVVVRGSGLFTAKKKVEGERIASYFEKLFAEGFPVGLAILFVEDDVDKRGKAYKAVKKLGKITAFEPLKESQLVTWAMETLRKSGLSLSSAEAVYLIRVAGGNMERAQKEMEKLSSYKKEGKITKADIDALCTKTPESRIFDLIDAISAKNRGAAIALYGELLAMKEQPIGILAMLSRQFRLMLKCRLLADKGYSLNDITGILGANPYSVKISSQQSRSFGEETLKQAVIDCSDCDAHIKTGMTEGKLAVEMLIVKYTERRENEKWEWTISVDYGTMQA